MTPGGQSETWTAHHALQARISLASTSKSLKDLFLELSCLGSVHF